VVGCSAELVQIAGDALQHAQHAWPIECDEVALVVEVRQQVDHDGLTFVEALQPIDTLPQCRHLVGQPSQDEVLVGAIVIVGGVASRRPAVPAQTVQVDRHLGVDRLAQELMHARPTEADRRGDRPDRQSLPMSGEYRPAPFNLRGFQPEGGQPQPLAEPLLSSPALLEFFARLYAASVQETGRPGATFRSDACRRP